MPSDVDLDDGSAEKLLLSVCWMHKAAASGGAWWVQLTIAKSSDGTGCAQAAAVAALPCTAHTVTPGCCQGQVDVHTAGTLAAHMRGEYTSCILVLWLIWCNVAAACALQDCSSCDITR